jgi:phage shock protein PspC (stress-responsive transcriptional regulator)
MQPSDGRGWYRSQHRVIGGVCAGIAENLHIDSLWIRLAFVVLAFAQGVGVLLYVILWVVMPERGSEPPQRTILDSIVADLGRAWSDVRNQFRGAPANTPPPPPAAATAATSPPAAPAPTPTAAAAAPPVAAGQRGAQNWSWPLGVALVVIGLVFLATNTGLVDWSLVWPVALIAVGIVLLIRTLEHRRG